MSTMGAKGAAAQSLPNYDALTHAPGVHPPLDLDASTAKLLRSGWYHMDHRQGVPSLVWLYGAPVVFPIPQSADPETAARVTLDRLASLYRMVPSDLRTVRTRSVHDTGFGAIIVKFEQMVDGVPVFLHEIRIMLDRSLRPVAVSGYLPTHAAMTSDGRNLPFVLTPLEAVAAAFGDATGTPADPVLFGDTGARRDAYLHVEQVEPAPDLVSLAQPARARAVFFNLTDRLEPGWYVEVMINHIEGDTTSAYGYVVSAVDGSVLFRKSQVESDYTYRVWAGATAPHVPHDGPQGYVGTPHPTGTPDGYVAPLASMNLVTLPHGPISTLDPWLAVGTTTTRGNNVDAYADLFGPDGFSGGDLRADTTAAGTFDRVFDPGREPQADDTQIMASVTNIFFVNNFLHDWFYDVGFDEASGNAQQDNYGRGGAEGDPILAEAQDYGGLNNANMQIPADGNNPRMQMFLFVTAGGSDSFEVNSPAGVAGTYDSEPAQFGPNSFDVTAELVLVDDGSGTTSDGCQTPFVNAAVVNGAIALVDRGTCTFVNKVLNAQNAGALGVIVANNTGGIMSMGGSDPSITIGSMMIRQSDGNTIKGALPGVNATMTLLAGAHVDGTLDNSVVSHEWGHYISNRLIGNASGLGTTQARGMGEGWSDLHALLMMAREEDAAHAANVDWTGAFAVGGYLRAATRANGQYFGFRRFPYSVDFDKNPLTFQHISNGVPLPSGPPQNPNGAPNSEVHNAGEIWGTMLWECYVALLTDTARLTFAEAQDRMKSYLVAGYKLTPASPTYVEGRDAFLAAAFAADVDDGILCAEAFARRGAGHGAVAPDRFSEDLGGVVESYEIGNDLGFVSASVDDSAVWCDADGHLDVGETGVLTVTLRNAGHGVLSETTATASSTHPGLSFANGGVIDFAPTNPFEEVVGTVEVTLDDATPMEIVDIDIDYTDPALTTAGVRSASISLRVDYDSGIPTRSDDVESDITSWIVWGDPSLGQAIPWSRVAETQADHRWGIPDNGNPSDQQLISPVLEVAATGDFTFSFDHRHRFEFSDDTWWDGGVIEISADSGASWQDIGASASPTYNCTLFDRADNPNPLAGQPAYGSASDSYPAMQRVDVNLGTAYQGQTVHIRFRVGTDWAAGDVGWEVDNLDFPTIDNEPFFTIGPDVSECVNARPVAHAGADQIVDEGAEVTLDGSASSDPDNDTLTYSWAQTSGPAVTLSATDVADPAFTAPEVEQDTEIRLVLTVSDGQFTSVPDEVTIFVIDLDALSDGGDGGLGGDGGVSGASLWARDTGCHCTVGGSAGDSGYVPTILLLLMAAASLTRRRR